nr:trehalose-phosphatase [Actinomycetota bacterium]
EVHTEAVARVAALDLPGAIVEDKEIMIGLHYRAASDPQRARAALEELARELSERHGLTRHRGRHVFELRPPVDLTKAAIVRRRVEEADLSAAAFAGDDRVDLPGFDALDELAERGLGTLRIAVASNEAPPELLERADVVVDGPAGALRFLRSLLPG